jgi:hypothetical protein
VVLAPERRARELVDERVAVVLRRQERERAGVDVAGDHGDGEEREHRIAQLRREPARVRAGQGRRGAAQPPPDGERPERGDCEPGEQRGSGERVGEREETAEHDDLGPGDDVRGEEVGGRRREPKACPEHRRRCHEHRGAREEQDRSHGSPP